MFCSLLTRTGGGGGGRYSYYSAILCLLSSGLTALILHVILNEVVY